jgi:hypothetical protein
MNSTGNAGSFDMAANDSFQTPLFVDVLTEAVTVNPL